MKRIMTIQDITCFGKCSVTIALPVISAIGVETAILPTALLSAHTLFPDNTKLDLGEEMPRIAGQWKRNGISFDAIYIGYLGTARGIETALHVIDQFADENTLVITDPVMGDHGRLYRGFDREYAGKCAELCGKSDLIVPNITEACLMTGMEYREKYDESYLRDLCAGLCRICAGTVVITGASIEEGKTGFYGMRAETGETFSYQTGRLDASYHGTGDLFASTAAGAMVRGIHVQQALEIAADYTAETIRETMKGTENPWYGVHFETVIPYLIRRVEEALRER